MLVSTFAQQYCVIIVFQFDKNGFLNRISTYDIFVTFCSPVLWQRSLRQWQSYEYRASERVTTTLPLYNVTF